ncbi:MAG: MFS transporter [Coriobacteriia bacterium]|nr:MFS transporter [Coriobacteriia bacterium]
MAEFDESVRDRDDDVAVYEADTEGPPAGIARGRTFDSFRHRDFRHFWSGALVSNAGSWMQIVALGWLVYELTGSELALGAVNFVQGVPVLLFILYAGAAADRFDRRRLLIWLQLAMMGQAIVLGVLTSTGHVTMPAVYALTLFGGTMTAFMFPAWQATVPDLVPKRLLLNAIALNSAQFNGARLVGPMIGALIFARFGVAEVFYVNAATFLVVIWALAVIRPAQERHVAEDGESRLRELAGGIGYAREHPGVAVLLLTTAAITLFGMPFAALLPAFADKVLGAGSAGYSVLLASNGFGALAGALVVAGLPHDVDRGRLVRFAVLAMGLLLLGLAASRAFWLAMLVLVGIGAAFMTATSSVNTSLQASVPPRLRGRVLSLFVLAFMGIMPFGALVFGAIARAIGPEDAIAIGAAVLALVGALLVLRPSLLADERPRPAPDAAP